MQNARDATRGVEIRAEEKLDNTRCRHWGGNINAVDRGMGQIGPKEMHMGLPKYINVVGVVPDPCQKSDIFAALCAGANSTVLRHLKSSLSEQAATTTPLWSIQINLFGGDG